jgi:hypothetical protein
MKDITSLDNLEVKHSKFYCIAKGDSGASNHYWRPSDKDVLKNTQTISGPVVQLPNNTTIQATESGELPLHNSLTATARQAFILPNLKSANLISIGQLCDDDCNIVLNKKHLIAVKNNKIIMRGARNKADGLWDIPISKTKMTLNCCIQPTTHTGMYMLDSQLKRINTITKKHTSSIPQSKRAVLTKKPKNGNKYIIKNDIFEHPIRPLKVHKSNLIKVQLHKQNNKINVIIRKKQTHMELAQYLHAACFSPVTSTFVRAIKRGHFNSWPGLTAQLINKSLPPSIATVKGHIAQEKQHLQSTGKHKTQNIHPIQDLCEKLDSLNINNPPHKGNHTDYDTNDTFPPFDPNNCKTNEVAYIVVDRKQLCTAYTDLTGRFPQRSSRGNEYVLIGYHYDGNSIMCRAIKDRTAASLATAWEHMHTTYNAAGDAPKNYILDNEKSNELMKLFKKI